jgi:integrase
MSRLTATSIEALKPRKQRYEVTDPACRGLQLRVEVLGSKIWLFRYAWGDSRPKLVLGHWPNVTLAVARELAEQAKKLVMRGIDPRSAGLVRTRPAPARPAPESDGAEPPAPYSVAFLASEFMRLHVTPHRKRPEYVQAVLDNDVLRWWSTRDARTIKPREVIELLDKVVDRGSKVMANRVASVLGQMFKFGIHRSIVETSPVQLLYRPGGKEKSRRRVLSEEELKIFLEKRFEACRFKKMAHVLMVLLLTMQRREELALATWDEFDFRKRAWNIPDAHSKNGRGHALPLTDWAIEELMALKKLAGDSRYVLPVPDGSGPIHPKYITRSVDKLRTRFLRIGIEHFTVHDLRRTGRTNLGRLKVPRHVAERVLNHTPERIEGTYDVWEYFEEKRSALAGWATHLSSLRHARTPQ